MRRPHYGKNAVDELEDLEQGRASKSEQKRSVQRLAAIGEQLSKLPTARVKKLPVDERLIDAILALQSIKSHEARRRQSQRIAKFLRHEDESHILSYLLPTQNPKKIAQVSRWVDRIIDQGDVASHEFSKQYKATHLHTLRQHYLLLKHSMVNDEGEELIEQRRQQLVNYIHQVVILSEQ